MLMDTLGLKVELTAVLEGINAQIDTVGRWARSQNLQIHEVRTQDGNWTLAPLLVAKAQVLSALVSLGPTDEESDENQRR